MNIKYNKDDYVVVGTQRILLTKNGGIPFIKSDLRRFELRFSNGLQTVYTNIFQIDIIRLMNMSKTINNAYYVEKFKRFLKQIDELHGDGKTDFDRKLPRRAIESGYVEEDSFLG